MKQLKFILSPVGTSLLTNNSSKEERDLLNKNSNVKYESEIPPEDAQVLRNRISDVQVNLEKADITIASRMSAEINGIVKIYDGQLNAKGDFHYLLCTDTWLGENTAKLVKSFLESHGLTVELRREDELQTKEFNSFQTALSNLAAWCSETVNSYRNSGYQVIFNLTGGFKSVQGFLQTLALFYADEAVYVFEQSDNLLRIPRLPIKMDAEQVVKNNLKTIRRLSMDLDVKSIEMETLPETFVLRIGDMVSLSAYGEIIWKETRREIYLKQIFDSPSEKLKFGESFLESVLKLSLPANRYIEINRKIDDLSREIETGQKLKSLDFKELKGNPCPPSTHEADAWHDQDAKRLFGHFEDGIFILDKLDKALH
jgi:putative CRISPR-associated protein (TIGR02619 family)